MAGESFQSERGVIKSLEIQAAQGKKADLQGKLSKKVFDAEAKKAGELLAKAESKLSIKQSKDKVSAYKKEISGYLKQVAEKGREAMKKENPADELAKIEELASNLSASFKNVQDNVPLFHDVEAAKAKIPDAIKKVEAARKAMKDRGEISEDDLTHLIGNAGMALIESEDALVKWRDVSLPSDIKSVLMFVQVPIDDMQAEIGDYYIEVQSKSFEQFEEPEKSAVLKLKSAKAFFDDEQGKIKGISDAIHKFTTDKTALPDDLDEQISSALEGLGKAQNEFMKINRKDIPLVDLTAYFDITPSKIRLQLQELADLKINLKKQAFIKSGLTEDQEKYIKFDKDGKISTTPELDKLPQEKQIEFKAKFKLIEVEVAIELDEKTAKESDKKMIEGRKKLRAGDPFGAKEDLLAFYNQEVANNERNPIRFEQTREMLKQIAKIELSQMVQRLAAMKASVKNRYNNAALGQKTTYGTIDVPQTLMFIEDMSRVLEETDRLIESGKALTVNDASIAIKKLDKDKLFDTKEYGISPEERSEAAILRKRDELKKDEVAKKLLEDKKKSTQNEYEEAKQAYERSQRGELNTLAQETEITPEILAWRKQNMEDAKAKADAVGEMSVEDVRMLENARLDNSMRIVKLQNSLERFQMGFPGASDQETFDMFAQQKKLDSPDPEVRKQGNLDLARKAREQGFTGMAKQLYENYFSKQLAAGARLVDREIVSKETLGKDEVKAHLSKFLETWKKDFEKQTGRVPIQAEIDVAQEKGKNLAVSDAYNLAVKRATHLNMMEGSGPEADEWKKVYSGKVGLEDFGQGPEFSWEKFGKSVGGGAIVGPAAVVAGAGAYLGNYLYQSEALWTDEQWNALPAKVGIMTAVTIASGGIGGAVARGSAFAARSILASRFGVAAVEGFLGTASVEGSVAGGSFAGRALGYLGEKSVEGAAFSMAQYELNGLMEGYQYERFSAEYLQAMGHSAVVMVMLGGIGSGVGKMRSYVEAGKATSFIEGGAEAMVKSATKDVAWWLGKTSIEGGAMVGLDAATALLAGREFTAKQAVKSFGDNFLFSATIGGVHAFMGPGAHQPGEKAKSKEEKVTIEAIDKYSKAAVDVDKAKSALEKAKAEGIPYAKLEAEVAKKEKVMKAAEEKLGGAEKAEERAKSALETNYYSIFSKDFPDDLQKEGKTAKDTAAWIDKNGRIHYSAEYFKNEFGVDMVRTKDGKNAFKVNGKEMGPMEFFGTAEGRTVLDKMTEVKTHEVTHRVLEFTEGASNGELGKSVGKMVAENPEIAAEFAKRGEKPDFRSIQEFLCEVADGRVKLSPEAKKQLEGEIGKSLPDFSFSAVRKIDTRLLSGKPEAFARNMVDAFTATSIIENPLLIDPVGKGAYDKMQKSIKAGLDPTKNMSKSEFEKAQSFADALARRNQVQILLAERVKINEQMSKHGKAYDKFTKLTGDTAEIAKKAEADMRSALKEGDYKKAQQVKDSYASLPDFYDALSFVEANFRFMKGNREVSILRTRRELDVDLREVAQKTPDEIAAFVADFNQSHPGFREGQRVKIADLPAGKGSIEIDQIGQLIYVNPFEDASTEAPKKNGEVKPDDFDSVMDDLMEGFVLPPASALEPKATSKTPESTKSGTSKPKVEVPRPTPSQKGDPALEPIKPMRIIDVKGPPLPEGFNPKYEGTPLEPHERFRAKMKIAEDAMTAEQVQEAFQKLDPADKEILKANVDHMSPDQLVAVLQKRYTQFPDGARYYEGKLAGQGGIADVHLTLFYRPGEPKMKEAVVKTPRTHDDNGQPYSPEEYAARARYLNIEASNARRIMALQHGNPPKLLKAMRPLYVSHDRIVYEDAHAGGGKFSDYEHAVEDPRIGADTMWKGFAETLEAINEMHENGLIHRDIKPENLAMAGLKPIEVLDASGNKTTKYVDGEGRILDIGSVMDADQIKQDKLFIKFVYTDGAGDQKFVQLPLDNINSANYDQAIARVAATFKIGIDDIVVAPASGGVTVGFYDPKMILAIREGKVPAQTQDFYALGASMENMGMNGWNKFDQSGNFVGPVRAKEVPDAHKPEFQRIVRGLKSYDPNDPDYIYVHTTLGGLKGVAERMREWYK